MTHTSTYLVKNKYTAGEPSGMYQGTVKLPNRQHRRAAEKEVNAIESRLLGIVLEFEKEIFSTEHDAPYNTIYGFFLEKYSKELHRQLINVKPKYTRWAQDYFSYHYKPLEDGTAGANAFQGVIIP